MNQGTPIAALHETILADAARWAARLRATGATPAERASFEAWIDADPAHREAYARCERVSTWPDRVRADPALFAELRVEAGSGAAPRSARRFGPWPLALAAGVAAAAIAITIALPRAASDAIEVATRQGEQRTLSLADGSTIEMNSRSAIGYRLTASERLVELHDGEVFFNVARDSARPFIVIAGKTQVRVVGTQFSVRRASDGVEVVVKEGKVEVVPEPGLLAASPRRVELTPGSRLQMETAGEEIKVAAVDVGRALAWRSGVASFDGAPLEEVLAEVNRYAERPLTIEDESLRAVRVSGRFRVGDVEGVRFLLRESFGIESVPHGGVIGLRAEAAQPSR